MPPLDRLLRSQIARYLAFGFLAVGVRVLFIWVFSFWWPSSLAVAHLGNEVRSQNNFIASSLAFVVSNLVAYLTNRAFVFQPGRTGQAQEFIRFTIVSLVGLGLGYLAGPLMIAKFGISGVLAHFNAIAAATVSNFFGRKYLVFAK